MLFRASKRLWKFRFRKLPKIENCATIKEIGKLKEIVVGSKRNRWVATNILLDHGYSFQFLHLIINLNGVTMYIPICCIGMIMPSIKYEGPNNP